MTVCPSVYCSVNGVFGVTVESYVEIGRVMREKLARGERLEIAGGGKAIVPRIWRLWVVGSRAFDTDRPQSDASAACGNSTSPTSCCGPATMTPRARPQSAATQNAPPR